MTRGTKGLIVAGAVLALGTWAKAQQVSAPPDVLPALLEEVKGLRAAMEQMASAGPRIQLFTARLQLQETRINNMIHRLDTVRDSLASAQRDYARVQQEQKALGAAIDEQQSSTAPEAREQAKQAAYMLEQSKGNMALVRANLDRYTSEETQLMGEIATEQARWSEINGRLDELERLLSSRR